MRVTLTISEKPPRSTVYCEISADMPPERAWDLFSRMVLHAAAGTKVDLGPPWGRGGRSGSELA